MQPDFSDLIGIPFVDGGRDPRAGVDCWGLFMLAMRRLGHEVPDYTISCFATATIDDAVKSASPAQWGQVERPDPGVAVTFALDPQVPEAIQHFGMCIDRWRFLHTLRKTNSMLSRCDDRYWRNKIRGFYRWAPSR